MFGDQPTQSPQPGADGPARQTIHAFQKWVGAGLDLLFPIQCVGCRRPGSIWCSDCDAQVERFVEPLCHNCGLPLTTRTGCPACRQHKPGLLVRSYARYTGRLVQGLLHLKYRPDRKLASVMADWLADLYYRTGWQATLVVPVPLSRTRQQQRGFNQAELLAAELASRLRLPLGADRLRRVIETRSQVGLNPTERRLNVKGAFQSEPGAFSETSVLLVDDLCTTGATLSACAKAIRGAGTDRVWGITVGRA